MRLELSPSLLSVFAMRPSTATASAFLSLFQPTFLIGTLFFTDLDISTAQGHTSQFASEVSNAIFARLLLSVTLFVLFFLDYFGVTKSFLRRLNIDGTAKSDGAPFRAICFFFPGTYMGLLLFSFSPSATSTPPVARSSFSFLSPSSGMAPLLSSYFIFPWPLHRSRAPIGRASEAPRNADATTLRHVLAAQAYCSN